MEDTPKTKISGSEIKSFDDFNGATEKQKLKIG